MGHAMGTLGSPKISFPSRPACVPLRQPAAPEKISLSTLLDIYCPSLLLEFRPAWWLFKRVHALSFSCCYALTQRSGHLQTLYASLGDFSAVDQISYDRWVIFQHHAVHVLRCTATGGYFGSRTVGPCQAIRSNAEELRSLSQQGSGFHTDCFRSCPPRRNANHCSFARPKWWFVHTPQCCLNTVPNTLLGSQESYVRAVLAPAILPVEQGGLGYRAVVVNSRGCTPSIQSCKAYGPYQSNQAQGFHSPPHSSIRAITQTISGRLCFISRISILGPRY